MGTGKTTVSRKLAAQLGWDYCDLDLLFETKYKIAISDFFEQYNEVLFRKLERDLLLETGNFRQTVIATGGGTPCFYNNMYWMRESGLTVFLKINPEAAIHRLMHSKKKRPLLINKTSAEIVDFIHEHLPERETFYQQAHIMAKAESCNLQELIKQIELRMKE
jgi:shikimate kinase